MWSKKRIIHALSYEMILLVILTLGLSSFLQLPLAITGTLGGIMAITAIFWNMLFKHAFEKIEVKWQLKRDLKVRMLHAMGFEGGLMLLTIPIVVYVLQVSLLEALLLDMGMTLWVMLYTLIFQWCYDQFMARDIS